jgi:hypothetical protein
MRQLIAMSLSAVVVLLLAAPTAFAHVIPEAELDQKKVFWGLPSSFEKPGEVEYEEIIKKTDEFREVKKKRVARGTGKYWILMSQASDRAVKAIAVVGEVAEYDLIASQGYLGSLSEPIPADDVTDLALDALKGKLKVKKNKPEEPADGEQ